MLRLLAVLGLTLAALPLSRSARSSTPETNEEELTALEDSEFQAADTKCNPSFAPEVSSLLALGSLGEGAQELAYVDYKCDMQETKEFMARFGLEGPQLNQKSFRNKQACDQGNVVWLYPMADSNSFTLGPNVCFRLLEWSKVACSVHVQRVSTVKEAQDFVQSFPAGSIMHLVLGGHGDGQALAFGEGPHMFGVTMDKPLDSPGLVAPVGRIVSWDDFITCQGNSCNPGGMMVPPKTLGYVLGVNQGLVNVMFHTFKMQKVSQERFESHKIHQEFSNLGLLNAVKAAMQQEGSIFVDSCLSASPHKSPNLANFVAVQVGKGVRVVGSTESFQQVNYESIKPWQASIHSLKARHTERTYVAKCPGSSAIPDADGNCECPAPTVCKTEAGKDCPVAGEKPKTYFLQACAESWAPERCTCLDPSAPPPSRPAAAPTVQSSAAAPPPSRHAAAPTVQSPAAVPFRSATGPTLPSLSTIGGPTTIRRVPTMQSPPMTVPAGHYVHSQSRLVAPNTVVRYVHQPSIH